MVPNCSARSFPSPSGVCWACLRAVSPNPRAPEPPNPRPPGDASKWESVSQHYRRRGCSLGQHLSPSRPFVALIGWSRWPRFRTVREVKVQPAPWPWVGGPLLPAQTQGPELHPESSWFAPGVHLVGVCLQDARLLGQCDFISSYEKEIISPN